MLLIPANTDYILGNKPGLKVGDGTYSVKLQKYYNDYFSPVITLENANNLAPTDNTKLKWRIDISGKLRYPYVDVYRFEDFTPYHLWWYKTSQSAAYGDYSDARYANYKREIEQDYLGYFKRRSDNGLSTETYLPKEFGYRWRYKPGTGAASSNWTFVPVIKDMTNTTHPINTYVKDIFPLRDANGVLQPRSREEDGTTPRYIEFKHTLTDLNAGSLVEIQIYCKDRTGQTFYGNNLMYNPSIVDETKASTKTISTGEASASTSTFNTPSASKTGFWYQQFDSWMLGNNGFFRPALSVSDINDSNGPHYIHYFLNKEFSSNKSYQFRTVIEGYWKGRVEEYSVIIPTQPWNPLGPGLSINTPAQTIASAGLLGMITPWGESFEYAKPFLPTILVQELGVYSPQSPIRFNIYYNTNINSYLVKNGTPEKPISKITSSSNPKNPVTLTGTKGLSEANGFGLGYFGITDMDWILQGFGAFSINSQVTPGKVLPKDTEEVPYKDPVSGDYFMGKGWHYLTEEKRLFWFDKVGTNTPTAQQVSYALEINENLPIGGNVTDYFSGKQASIEYLINNFAALFVPHQNFNLRFKYANYRNFGLTMYVGSKLPYRKSSTEWYITDIDELIGKKFVTKVAVLSDLVPVGELKEVNFVGLEGNQYLFFVADPIIQFYDRTSLLPSANLGLGTKTFVTETKGYSFTDFSNGFNRYSMISLSDFVITASYNLQNNQIFQDKSIKGDWSLTEPKIENAVFTFKRGFGNNLDYNDEYEVTLYSKAGNGSFNSGIWENGVWNNGWRDDKTIREFYEVLDFYSTERNSVFRIKIKGPKSSTSSFRVADKVSISNLIVIDINRERNLLKNYFTVVETAESYIVVEFEYFFNVMSIEIDSKEHRINVSRNVWLRGVFFNGYFKGIWNDGIFSGYPMITKMDESHWIDGIFNGGHFTANKKKLNFSEVNSREYNNFNWLSLSFGEPHGLTENDIISITYSTQLKPLYTLGKTTVLNVPDEKTIVTDIAWTPKYNLFEEGTVHTFISTGLVQNFDFYSNNVSKVTSIESLSSESVFSYNSWMDLNYSDQSAINIGRPETYLDKLTGRQTTDNNLYGYPTYDVVTSKSVFRDSFSLENRRYKLGTRYEIFNNYIGESGNFEDYFESTDTAKGLQYFTDQGWESDRFDSSVMYLKPDAMYYTTYPDGSPLIEDANPLYQSQNPSPEANKLYFEFRENSIVSSWKVGDTVEFSGPYMEAQYYWIYEGKWIPLINIYNNQYNVFTASVKTETLTIEQIVKTTNQAGEANYKILTNHRQFHTAVLIKDVPPNGPYGILNGLGYRTYMYVKQRYQLEEKNYNQITQIPQATYAPFQFKVSVPNGLTFSRSKQPTTGNTNLKGTEMKADVSGQGGVLNLLPNADIPGRANGLAKKTVRELRYTFVEFDILKTEESSSKYFEDSLLGNIPPIHFNNLNFVKREKKFGTETKMVTSKASFLPVAENINHMTTVGTKKQEFFFNKQNLMMNLKGTGLNGQNRTIYYFDNIKLYEVDMIPFFLYFKEKNINKSVQIPNSTVLYGKSPFIDYTQNVNTPTNEDEILSFYDKLVISAKSIPDQVNWTDEYSSLNPLLYAKDLMTVINSGSKVGFGGANVNEIDWSSSQLISSDNYNLKLKLEIANSSTSTTTATTGNNAGTGTGVNTGGGGVNTGSGVIWGGNTGNWGTYNPKSDLTGGGGGGITARQD